MPAPDRRPSFGWRPLSPRQGVDPLGSAARASSDPGGALSPTLRLEHLPRVAPPPALEPGEQAPAPHHGDAPSRTRSPAITAARTCSAAVGVQSASPRANAATRADTRWL